MELVNPPTTPPLTWATENPDWYVDGQTVQIMLEGPEAGRACGLVQPARGKSKYMSQNRHFGRDVPVTSLDGLRSANTGPMMFDDDGDQVAVNCGSIAIAGGHSSSVRDASNNPIIKTAAAAREWLNRQGIFAGLATEELALYGRYEAVTEGPNAGAVMFRGCAYPTLTINDAMVINNTTMSGENWADPQYGGREVFVGAARVQRTAFPYDEPLALAAELESDDAPGFVVYGQEGDTRVVVQEPQIMQPMHAELEESDITELRNEVAALRTDLNSLTEAFADLAIKLTTGDDLTLDQRMASVNQRIAELEQELKNAVNKTQQPGGMANQASATPEAAAS